MAVCGSVVLRVEVCESLVEEGEKLAKKQSYAHGVGFFGIKREMDVVSLRFTHSLCRYRKLQAGTGEETAFVAFVQPVGDVRCGITQPFQPRSVHQFTGEGHERSLL